MKKTITWIVVADGTRARLFANEGPGKGLILVRDGEITGRNQPGREIQADRPGRTFDRGGQGRHAMEPRTDPQRHDKEAFAQRLAAILDDARKKGAFARLVVVAPPQALGDLRSSFPQPLRDMVTGELNKDLTEVAIHDLPAHLGSVLAL